MKKIFSLFKSRSQKEPSEKISFSDNLPSVAEKVWQEPEAYQEPAVFPPSPPIENTKAVIKVESEVRALVPIMRSEFNFLKYPFFDISHRTGKRNEIEIREFLTTEEGTVETFWRVSRNVKSNFPASFARKIHTEVVERTVNELHKPISRLVKLGSLRDMCQKLNIALSGENIKNIKKALVDIQMASIKTKGTFRTKESNGVKKSFEGHFSLYDMVFFTGETLPDGKKADAVYVALNDMYVQNYNNNYTIPLDYLYMQSIKGDIASRMYECLSLWFFPAMENGKNYIQKPYSILCNYFPLTSQGEKWKAKKQLKTAHNQHVSSGFLAKEPEWTSIPGKPDDWIIKYFIGPKALEWYRNIKTDKPLEIEYQSSPFPKLNLPGRKKPARKDTPKVDNPVVAQLVNLGIAQKVAEGLVSLADPDVIQDQIEALPYRKNIEDRAAFLIKAIQENYPLPEKVKEKRAAEEQEREERLKREYHEYILTQVDEHLKQMDPEQIRQELKAHEDIFYAKFPNYEEFRGGEGIKAYIRSDYKMSLAAKLELPAFEEWKNSIDPHLISPR